jgi:hypothetical protein
VPFMIEPMMFFGLGLLTASLMVLMFVPLVHNRAVRLTMRRLRALMPESIVEIQADKDRLRAEFAMSTRRLEMIVEQLKAKTINQLAELAQKSDTINRLKLELVETSASVFALEARESANNGQLLATEDELAVKINSSQKAERVKTVDQQLFLRGVNIRERF